MLLDEKIDPRVDELVELLDWEALFKADPRYARLAALKKELCAEADGSGPPDSEALLRGATAEVVFRAATRRREITDLRRVHALLGDDVFYKVATVPLTALDDYLPPDQRVTVTKTERGARTIKLYRRR